MLKRIGSSQAGNSDGRSTHGGWCEATSEARTPVNLFLEGPRGAGKTTLLFGTLASSGLRTGGFAVRRVYAAGRSVGMEMVDLAAGTRDWLMTFDGSGRRQVNVACFRTVGVPAIRRALAEADIAVLDELGRFELDVPEFIEAVTDALDAPVPVVGVLKDESNWFLDGIRKRPDTWVIRLEEGTRETVAPSYRQYFSRLLWAVGLPRVTVGQNTRMEA